MTLELIFLTSMPYSIILFICIFNVETMPPLQLLHKLPGYHALSLCLCWHCSLILEHFYFPLFPAKFFRLSLTINYSSNYSCPMGFLSVCLLYFVLMISLSSCQISEIAEVLSVYSCTMNLFDKNNYVFHLNNIRFYIVSTLTRMLDTNVFKKCFW